MTRMLTIAMAVFTTIALQAADGTWHGADGNWSDSANWQDGIIADNGGHASFIFTSSRSVVTILKDTHFSVSGITVTGNSGTFSGIFGTLELVAPALVTVDKTVFFKRDLSGSDGFNFLAPEDNIITLEMTNSLSGPVTATLGRMLLSFDRSLGEVPATVVPAAITLTNATLGNFGAPGVELHPHRGITLVDNGYLNGRVSSAGAGYLVVNGPITGAGNLNILRQSSFVELTNPDNDYSGDTILGGGSGRNGYETTPESAALLRLGADDVLPRGSGAGRLLFAKDANATLDLRGFDQTLNSMAGIDGGTFSIINSAETAGVLSIGLDDGDMDLAGTIGEGVVLRKIGSGALTLALPEAQHPPTGVLLLDAGTLEIVAGEEWGIETLLLNGGVLHQAPDAETTALLAPATEITADSILDRSDASSALVWRGHLFSRVKENEVLAELTVESLDGLPLYFGATDGYAIMSATINHANGVEFVDNTWLDALPGCSWSVGGGATLALGITGVLNGDQTLNDFSLALPLPNALGHGDEEITVNGSGNAIIFDTTRLEGGALVADPLASATFANTVNLNGTDSSVIFDGAGSIQFGGTISGSGTLIKRGSGTTTLLEANDFTGEIIVEEGVLIVTEEAQLGATSNPIVLAGGTLDLQLASTTITRDITASASSDLYVQAGSQLTLSGATAGSIVKQGAGTLILTATNPALDIHVAEGTLILDAAIGPAVRHILGVDSAASALIAASGGNQIGGSVKLNGGSLDLAGHSESIAGLAAEIGSSTLTNSAATPVTLVIDLDTASSYHGAIGGAIALEKEGAGEQALSDASYHRSSLNTLALNQGTLAWGLPVRHLRFRTLTTREPGTAPSIGEFQLMRHGKVIPWPEGTLAAASEELVENGAAHLIDDNSASWWQGAAADSEFTITLPQPLTFDGYRWYFGATNLSGEATSAPTSWQLYVSGDGQEWTLADSGAQNLAAKHRNSGAKAGEWPLRQLAGDFAGSITTASGTTLAIQHSACALAAISGGGTLALRAGSCLTDADLSAFSGDITAERGGTLALGSALTRDPATLAARLEIANHGAGEVPLIVEHAAQRTLLTTLKDGAAPLGLTKRGSGELLLSNSGNSYSGATSIEDGTITINFRKSHTWRFLRFEPLSNQIGAPASGYSLAFTQLQLQNDGALVPWPGGTSATVPLPSSHKDDIPARVVNNNISDRWLAAELQPLTIDTQVGVSFNGYAIYTSGANNADHQRAPRTWTLEGSDDGITWHLIDARNDIIAPPYASGVSQSLGNLALANTTLERPPAELLMATAPERQFVSGVTARYLRFNVAQVRDEILPALDRNDGFMLTELQLLYQGAALTWPATAVAYAPGGQWNALPQCNASKIINNYVYKDNDDRWLSSAFVNPMTVTLPAPLTFDSYQYFTGHQTLSRDPTGWQLAVSSDGVTWHNVDERLNEEVTTVRSAQVGPFPLRLPNLQQAVDMLPDCSAVEIAANGRLKLALETLETIGALNGSGTLELGEDARLTLNLCQDGEFSGSIENDAATLALGGTGTQSFAAAASGDLTLDFDGGAIAGSLDVAGALTITGSPRFGVPASLPSYQKLFSFSSMDPTSRQLLEQSAAALEVPQGFIVTLRLSATEARLSIATAGTLLMIH